MKLTNKKNGFTIVELVIVIAVIAILAAVLIPTFSGVVAKANASAAQQLAMNGVKAGLMMTNTATLPANTGIYVASDKTNINYAYQYTGNELKEISLKVNDKINSDYTKAADTILISDKSIVTTTDTTVTPNTTTTTIDGLLEKFLEAGLELEESTTFTVTLPTETTSGKINWGTGESAKSVDYYTSVDLPTNVILFVKMK